MEEIKNEELEYCIDCNAVLDSYFMGEKENISAFLEGKYFPDGKAKWLCVECKAIRKEYFEKTKKNLPLETVCEGCVDENPEEHNCRKIMLVIDDIFTKKPCSCSFCRAKEDLEGFLFNIL